MKNAVNIPSIAKIGLYLGLMTGFYFFLFSNADAQAWTTVNSASSLGNGHYGLTNAAFQFGSVWAPDSLDLSVDFDKTFFIQQYHPTSGLAGDGMAFVMHRDPQGLGAYGGAGNGLGYGNSIPATNGPFAPVSPSISIELDLWNNTVAGIADHPDHHTAVHENGVLTSAILAPAQAVPPLGTRIDDGVCRKLRIQWDASLNRLYIDFDGVPILSGSYNMVANTFGGNSKVIYGFTGSCGSAPAVQVVGIPLPANVSDTVLCRNDSVSISVPGGLPGSYTWTNVTTGSAQGLSCTNCDNPSFGPFGANPLFRLAVQYSDSMGIGCTWQDSLDLTIENNPFPLPGPDQAICSGDSVLVGNPGAVAGIVYSWSPPTGLNNSNSNQPNASPANSTQYYLSLVDTSTLKNCSAIDSMTLSVNPNPVANAGPDDSICPGDSAQLGALPVGGLSYTWTPPPTLSNGGISNPMAFPLVDTEYLLAVQVALTGCTDTDSVWVRLKPVPNAFAGNDTSLCGTSLQMTASILPNESGIWSLGSGSGSVNPFTNPIGLATGLQSAGLNQFIWMVKNGSNCGDMDTVNITSFAPVVANAGKDSSLCGDSLALTASPVFGSGNWTVINSPGNLLSPTNDTCPISGLAFGPNIFQWSVQNGLCQDTDTVVINASQLIQANAGPDTVVCGSQSILQGNNPTPGLGVWTLLNGPGLVTSNSSFNSPVTGLGLVQTLITWNITNGACYSIDTVALTGLNLVSANAGADTSICRDSIFLYANQPPAGASGNWTFLNGASGVLASPFSPTSFVNGLDTGFSQLVWGVQNGTCIENDTLNIHVDILPISNAGPDQIGLVVNATTMGALSPAIGMGNWTLLSGGGVINAPSSPTTVISALPAGNSIFSWTVTNGVCPVAVDEVTLNVELQDSIIIPEGFSPNNDGVNDVFNISGIEKYFGTNLLIFNRWGSLVQKFGNYQNQWAGENREGKPLVDDTYYIVLDLPSGEKRSSFVVIKR